MGSLTELNASTGTIMQTLIPPGIDAPADLAVRGGDMWVVSDDPIDSGSVAKLNTNTGSTIWTASGARYGFTDPSAIAIDGTGCGVTNLYAGGSGRLGDRPERQHRAVDPDALGRLPGLLQPSQHRRRWHPHLDCKQGDLSRARKMVSDGTSVVFPILRL